MKKLFKFIVFLVLFAVISVLTLFVLLTAKPNVPTDEYNLGLSTFNDIISNAFDSLLTNTTEDSILAISVESKEINNVIKEYLLNPIALEQNNEDYINNTSDTVFNLNGLIFKGAWVQFKGDLLIVEAGLSYEVVGIKVETVVSFSFGFELVYEESETFLKVYFDSVKIGKLPFKNIKTADFFLHIFNSDLSVQDLLNDFLDDFGHFDSETKTGTIYVNKLLEKMDLDNNIKHFLNILLSNEFVNLGIDSDIHLGMALGKLLKNKEYPVKSGVISEDSFKNLIIAKSATIFTSFLHESKSPFITIDSDEISGLIANYILNDKDADSPLIEFNIYSSYNFRVELPVLKFVDDKVNIYLEISIYDTNDITKIFTSVFSLSATINFVPNGEHTDLEIEIFEITNNDFVIGQEEISYLLSLFGESNDFIKGSKFIFSSIDELIGQDALSFGSFIVKNSKLYIFVNINPSAITELIENSILHGLELILNDDSLSLFYDSVDTIINSLDQIEINEAIELFNELIYNVDIDTGLQIYNILVGALEENGIFLDNFLNYGNE